MEPELRSGRHVQIVFAGPMFKSLSGMIEALTMAMFGLTFCSLPVSPGRLLLAMTPISATDTHQNIAHPTSTFVITHRWSYLT